MHWNEIATRDNKSRALTAVCELSSTFYAGNLDAWSQLLDPNLVYTALHPGSLDPADRKSVRGKEEYLSLVRKLDMQDGISRACGFSMEDDVLYYVEGMDGNSVSYKVRSRSVSIADPNVLMTTLEFGTCRLSSATGLIESIDFVTCADPDEKEPNDDRLVITLSNYVADGRSAEAASLLDWMAKLIEISAISNADKHLLEFAKCQSNIHAMTPREGRLMRKNCIDRLRAEGRQLPPGIVVPNTSEHSSSTTSDSKAGAEAGDTDGGDGPEHASSFARFREFLKNTSTVYCPGFYLECSNTLSCVNKRSESTC